MIFVALYVEQIKKMNKFEANKRYIIRKKGSKNEVMFIGTFLYAYDYHYLFANERGMKASFLKIDFEIGEYISQIKIDLFGGEKWRERQLLK